MKYFILSPYWTRHNKKDIYWGQNSNGYTDVLADAGVYDEKDKLNMQEHHEIDRCEFIPITNKLLDEAYNQLRAIMKECNCDLDRENERHLRYLSNIQDEQNRVNAKYQKLENISKEIS